MLSPPNRPPGPTTKFPFQIHRIFSLKTNQVTLVLPVYARESDHLLQHGYNNGPTRDTSRKKTDSISPSSHRWLTALQLEVELPRLLLIYAGIFVWLDLEWVWLLHSKSPCVNSPAMSGKYYFTTVSTPSSPVIIPAPLPL